MCESLTEMNETPLLILEMHFFIKLSSCSCQMDLDMVSIIKGKKTQVCTRLQFQMVRSKDPVCMFLL